MRLSASVRTHPSATQLVTPHWSHILGEIPSLIGDDSRKAGFEILFHTQLG